MHGSRMSMEKTEGLVIRTTDFSETSRIVVIFTRDFGKISAIAKGGRRLKGAFESALDLLATCRIVFVRKSSTSLDLLTEAQLIGRFRPTGQKLKSFYTGYYIAELLQGLTEDYDPHPQLYTEVRQTLDRLEHQEDIQNAVLRFQLVLLREIGQLPSTETCSHCGTSIEQAGTVAYWVIQGGIICAKCHRKEPKGFRIQLGSLAVIKRLMSAEETALQRLQISSEQVRETQHVLTSAFSRILGRRPRTLRYLQF